MKELSVEEISKHISKFNQIYDENGNEINPIPEGVKITVYCKSDQDEGFADNVTRAELGLNALIARSWILEDELRKLCEEKIKKQVQQPVDKFNLDYQYELYLKRVGLSIATMPDSQKKALKMAFMGACGQMLLLLRDDVGAMDEKQAVSTLEKMIGQVSNFFALQVIRG